VGPSGAGKSTLLETMAGLRRPTAGSVTHGGVAPASGVTRVGFVPQDDIVHRELPLRRTLRYAALLRLPSATSAARIDEIVDDTLRDLDLTERADVRVGDLSGGQRKRASVAVELLTRPRLFFLDEPTSGLDPVTAADVLVVLRRLADCGVTVVVTTHNPADIDVCDRVVFLRRDGHLGFAGTPAAARTYFGVTDLAHAYRRLADDASTPAWAEPNPRGFRRSGAVSATRLAETPGHGRPVGWFRQWAVLTRRNADVVVRNRLTLAVLVGSPALVTAMMAVLFRPGAFRATGPGALGPAQTVFWVAFAGFFFGLTYGLLQIVGERAVFRRERLAGLDASAYVASKIALLLPVLAGVAVVLLGVLRGLDRLPAAGWDTYALLLVALVVESLCALTLGLLASAAVADATQATLALPMLCFPQVLFAGAVVPVGDMAGPGHVISAAMANRWAFESLGRALDLDALTANTPAMAAYHDAMAGSALTGCVVLLAFAGVFAAATVAVLRRGAHA
jgi:ABC-type multidrug transport system ATPase subunit